jgi:hypothetical protein
MDVAKAHWVGENGVGPERWSAEAIRIRFGAGPPG